MIDEYTLEYDLPPCERCGEETEYVDGPAKGWCIIRCPICGWSKLTQFTYIDDEWVYTGQHICPGRIGDWIPYIPGDSRRKGLADWQLAKPPVTKRDITFASQCALVMDTLGYLADTLTPIVVILHKEPYLMQKAEKLEKHLGSIIPLLPPLTRKTPYMIREEDYRAALYHDLRQAFLPAELLCRHEIIQEEEIRPYLWGFVALCYHWWVMMNECEVNCPEALALPGVRKHWYAIRVGLEALCSRYGAESNFYRLAAVAIALREAKYNRKPKKKRKK